MLFTSLNEPLLAAKICSFTAILTWGGGHSFSEVAFAFLAQVSHAQAFRAIWALRDILIFSRSPKQVVCITGTNGALPDMISV